MIKRNLKRLKRKIVLRVEEKKGAYSKYVSFPSNGSLNGGIIIMTHDAHLGGVPLVSLNLTKQYIRNGYEVNNIIFREGPLLERFASMAPVQICYSREQFETAILKLEKLNYKKVICNGAASGRYLDCIKNRGMKVVSMIHELPGAISELSIEKYVYKMVEKSDAVIFPSNFVKNKIINLVSEIRCNTFVFHQGLYILPTIKMNKEEAKQIVAKKYEFSENCKLFLNIATINERKGFDLFVKMALLDPMNIYLWVGNGLDSRFGKRTIKKCGGELPINLILPGYIQDEDAMSLIYRAADLFLLTSREEPFGSVVLEAFSNGTPVVAFDNCGGFIDVVINGITGQLCDINNLSDTVNSLHAICDDKDYKLMSDKCISVAKSSDFESYSNNILSTICN